MRKTYKKDSNMSCQLFASIGRGEEVGEGFHQGRCKGKRARIEQPATGVTNFVPN